MTQSTRTIDRDGVIRWKVFGGLLHREGGPAIINPNGSERWFIEDIEIEGPSQITRELESKYPEFCGLFFIQYMMA